MEGHSRVRGGRNETQHAIVGARDGATTRALYDGSHGKAFVHGAKLSLSVRRRRRVMKRAAVEQRAVHVCDHGTDVTKRFRARALIDVRARGVVPLFIVRLVHAVHVAALRNSNIALRQHEGVALGVVRKRAHAAVSVLRHEAQNEHRRRAVQNVTDGRHVSSGTRVHVLRR